MFCFGFFLLSLSCLPNIVAAAHLTSFPTLTARPPQNNQKHRASADLIATSRPQEDLRRRQLGGHNTCGSFGAGINAETITCLDPAAYCVAGFLSNANAYAVCSTPLAVGQVTITAAFGNWSRGSPCPASAYCWSVSYLCEACRKL